MEKGRKHEIGYRLLELHLTRLAKNALAMKKGELLDNLKQNEEFGRQIILSLVAGKIREVYPIILDVNLEHEEVAEFLGAIGIDVADNIIADFASHPS